MKSSRLVMILTIILTLLKVSSVFAWDYPLEFYLYYIDFDNASGSANDALDIRKNASTNIVTPEYYPAGSRNNRFAYIKSQTNRQIEVWLGHNQGSGEICNATVYTTSAGYPPGNVSPTTFYFDYNGACNNWGYHTLTLSGTVTSSVKKASTWGFSLYWKVSQVDGETLDSPISFATSGNHAYYVLLATPQAPMSEPWTDVLDYSCAWAVNQSSLSSALSLLTTNLYNSGVDYNKTSFYTTGHSNLDLTELLNDFSNPSNVDMDCKDFSNFLQVLLNSLGGTCEYCILDNELWPYYVDYNYIFPAGMNEKWPPGRWNFHQVGWENSKVADAALKIDNDADPTDEPHTWKLSKGDMTLSAYLDKLTEMQWVDNEGTGTVSVD